MASPVAASGGELDQALGCFRQAEQILQEVEPRTSGAANVARNIGSVWLARGDFDQARSYAQQSLSIAKAVYPRSAGTAQASSVLGLVYIGQGELALALALCKFVPDVDLTSWRLPARAPTGDLLTDVMAAIRDHGLVALEAAMYEAEHRPDPPRPLRPQMPPGQWQLGQPP